MTKPYLSIIVPAYNEEKRILSTLKRIKEYMSAQSYPYEVIVVIDGAKDKTTEVSKSFQLGWPELKILNNTKNHGKGYVVRQGMLAAEGDYRIFTDADNSTDIRHVEKMIPKFKEGFHVVIGTRDYKDAIGARQAVSQPWFKRLLGNMGNLFIQIMVLPGIWDTQAGFKGFSEEAALKIFPKCLINRWAFDVEILALAGRYGYKIAKIPLYWENDPESHVKLSSYFNFLFETVKVRLNLWRGKYQ